MSKPVYKEEDVKTKIKSYKGKIKTDFHSNAISKEGSQCICVSAILIDSIYRKDKIYYPQVFLEECKYVATENKMSKFITDDRNVFSLMKKILMKKIKYRFLFWRKYIFFNLGG